MAETLVKAADYLQKRKEIEQKMEMEIQKVEEKFNSAIKNLKINYNALLYLIDLTLQEKAGNPKNYFSELKNELKSSKNPFFYYSIDWIKEIEKEYNGNACINIELLTKELKRKIERERDERLKCVKENLDSKIKLIQAKYESEIQNLDCLFLEVKQITKSYGLEPHFTYEGLRLEYHASPQGSLSFFIPKNSQNNPKLIYALSTFLETLQDINPEKASITKEVVLPEKKADKKFNLKNLFARLFK